MECLLFSSTISPRLFSLSFPLFCPLSLAALFFSLHCSSCLPFWSLHPFYSLLSPSSFLHLLFPLLPPASISPSPGTYCIYLYFCSSPLSEHFNTIGIKCWHDLLGILKQPGILVRLFECLIFSARRWLKPLKCFGNTYSTVAPMKPIKNLIWMRERKEEEEKRRGDRGHNLPLPPFLPHTATKTNTPIRGLPTQGHCRHINKHAHLLVVQCLLCVLLFVSNYVLCCSIKQFVMTLFC